MNTEIVKATVKVAPKAKEIAKILCPSLALGLVGAGVTALVINNTKKNTSYNITYSWAKVIDKGERHTNNVNFSINAQSGVASASNTSNDDYWVQFEMEDTGEIFTHHGLNLFDSTYKEQRVGIKRVKKFYKNKYQSTKYYFMDGPQESIEAIIKDAEGKVYSSEEVNENGCQAE